MQKSIKFIIYAALPAIVLLIFKVWFTGGLITAGDLWPYSDLVYSARSIVPYAWDLNTGNGLGGFVGPLLWIYLNFGTPLTILGSWLGFSWNVIERVWYFYPFLILSVVSSYKLFSKVFSNSDFSVLASFIYLLNSYILMVIGGGQLAGIGMAYSLIPLVVYLFISINEKVKDNKKGLTKSIFFGLALSAQFIFDIRISYITLVAISILWLLQIRENKKNLIKSTLFIFVIPAVIVFLLNSFWIIPTAVSQKNPVVQMGLAYSSNEAVRFLSFAKFEDTISLLHPNWPENIFGRVGFVKPEFILLPVLAFISLLFIKDGKKEKNKFVICFAALGLLGTFLAKGSNEPFGEIYIWLFNYFPGFIMFRDPTKWYVLVAFSYSMLIPFSIWKIYEWIKIRSRFQASKALNLQNLFLIIVSFYLVVLVSPAVLGQLSGTFKTSKIPNEYKKLENYLSRQPNFFRTFWLPTIQRFAYYSNNHPAIPAQVYLNKQNKELINFLHTPDAEKRLEEASVKYVIVPYDSQGEIYLKDRKYDTETYKETLINVSKVSWLKKIEGFGNIGVFEVSSPKDHFFTNSKSLSIDYSYISPVKYTLDIKNAAKGDRIVFSENFDSGWNAEEKEKTIASAAYNGLNSFLLTKHGSYILDVNYSPQRFVNIGSIISILSLAFIAGVIIFGFKYKK